MFVFGLFLGILTFDWQEKFVEGLQFDLISASTGNLMECFIKNFPGNS
jgi:hypothetical protein